MSDAMTAGAGYVGRFGKCRTQSLPRQLHQSESRNLAELHPCAVVFERIAQPILDIALVLRALHVDEVDNDQSAEVAEPQLARDFVGGLEIRVVGRRFDVASTRRTG